MNRVIVIGGGIAGLSVLRALAVRGVEALLLEREPQLGMHSSRLSAGMFRLTIPEPVNVQLAVRSHEIACGLAPGGFLRQTGGLYLCDDDALRTRILDSSSRAGVVPAVSSQLPPWLSRRHRPAVFSPGDGIIDTNGLLAALAADARNRGAQIRTNAPANWDRSGGRVDAVVANGERLTGQIVDCTGAWSDLPVQIQRRHLFVLSTPNTVSVSGVVWDLSENIYVRPRVDGILVSPCDESIISPTSEVPLDPGVSDLLRSKLSRWAPALASAPIVEQWAGMRPLTQDHKFIIGADPSIPGLFRVGGFGGHGMTAGLAAGDMAAAILCGESPAGAKELAPSRSSLAK